MKVALLGDTALFGRFSMSNKEIFNFFNPLKVILSDCDYIVANLETPFTTNSKPYGSKSAYISSLPENIEILKHLGVNIVNLANNHLFDYGKKAFQETKDILTKNGIEYFGVENKQLLIENENCKIRFSGFCCYSTNPLGLGKKGVNILSYKTTEKTLKKDKEKQYNTILSIHAGQEHVNYPNLDHVKFARKLSEIKPYVFYGHHPHVLQGIEEYNESLIAYSLGNFCFDDIYTRNSSVPLIKQSNNNNSSIILILEYENNQLVGHQRIPIFLGDKEIELQKNLILDNLQYYSSCLQLKESEYLQLRASSLNAVKKEWSSKRDLYWIIKRLNIKTLIIIKDLFWNKLRYNSIFKKYL